MHRSCTDSGTGPFESEALAVEFARTRSTENGQVYEVEIPEDDELLDWDATLIAQSTGVKAAIQGACPELFVSAWMELHSATPTPEALNYGRSEVELRAAGFDTGIPAERMTGQQFYRWLGAELAQQQGRVSLASNDQRHTSEYLDELGIKGVRYRDKAAGDVSADACSYVIFHPRDARITNALYQPSSTSKYEPAPLFFSALERAVEGINARSMLPQHWMIRIRALVGKQNVKADEIEWTSVLEWLDTQQGKVSKDDVLAYLRGKGVQVQDVVLENEAMKGNRWEGIEGGAKYQHYTLPGGENYREVLLTLPPVGRESSVSIAREMGFDPDAPLPALATEAIQRCLDESAERRDAQFRSRHWSRPNVLAHIRLNDRTDLDGKRVLFVEEIQSDWAQQGRKKGFGPELPFVVYSHDTNEVLSRHATLDEAEAAAEARRDAGEPRIDSRIERCAVPAAPFVGKTDAWVALALKRVLRMAAEGGYDRVAFISGKQCAQRYDLSKQIRCVEATKTLQGKYAVTATNLIGKRVLDDVYDKDRLPDVVGRELAERIVEEATSAKNPGERHCVQYRGLDRNVGGEGMRAFYDNIVPRVLRQVLAAAGGGELAVVQLRATAPGWSASAAIHDGCVNVPMTEELHHQVGFAITPTMRTTALNGLPLFDSASAYGATHAQSAKTFDAEANLGSVRPAKRF